MPHVTRSDQDKFISSILDHVNTGQDIELPNGFNTSNAWNTNWLKLKYFLDTGIPQYTIYTKGNGKLPFYSFSSLPGVTCPGAGPCLEFCYSFKAWRYPAAFFRQIQNTILLMSDTGRKYLREEFNKLKPNHDFRLYVDGDFDSLKTMKFWMDLLKTRPDIRAYGYSKSWKLFIEYDKLGYTFPDNYQLNLSSGSIYQNNKTILDQISKLPIYRGEFIALPSEKMPNILEDRPSFTAWAKQLRQRAKLYGIKKAWVCPGKCGNCTPTGHACGSKRFKNVPIIIGIH
tara:strand:+ start:449 stop:1306 length:858 start_codon:yes stop_codon:yes gene_type:complete